MKDEKGFSLFKKQAEIVDDIMWLDNETGIAICDEGGNEDIVYKIKDKKPFEFYRLGTKSEIVKFAGYICRQIYERRKL